MSNEVTVVPGDFVHWYPGGRVDGDPCPALVLRVHNKNMLSLNVYNIETGQATVRNNVWPVDHQSLIDSPLLAAKHGAWTHTRWKLMQAVSQESAVMQNQPVEKPVESTEKPRLQKKMDAQPA